MESFELALTDSGFHISGFPDATKVIKLSGHKAQQLSELASHRSDLLIALACLEGINDVAPDSPLARIHRGREVTSIVYVVKTSGTKGEPLKRATWTLTGSGSSQICQPPFG